MRVLVKRIPNSEDIPLPAYATAGAAGADIHAAIEGPLLIEPGEWRAICTGITIELPPGYEAQLRARSGLALKSGVVVAQGIGTIDEDFRGVVHVILINHGPKTFEVNRGDRIAQLVIAPVTKASFELVDELSTTERGEAGFGSTGTHALPNIP